MAQTTKSAELQHAIQQHLPQIEAWRAEGVPQREIARRLHVPDSSLRGALKRVLEGTSGGSPTEVYPDRPALLPPAITKVYEGIPTSSPEAIKVVIEEARSLLPIIREMAQQWDILRSMIAEHARQKQLLEVSPAYQPYEGFYSCRLSHRLIQDIRAYAVEHRLSQSELVTVALQSYMQQQP